MSTAYTRPGYSYASENNNIYIFLIALGCIEKGGSKLQLRVLRSKWSSCTNCSDTTCFTTFSFSLSTH